MTTPDSKPPGAPPVLVSCPRHGTNADQCAPARRAPTKYGVACWRAAGGRDLAKPATGNIGAQPRINKKSGPEGPPASVKIQRWAITPRLIT